MLLKSIELPPQVAEAFVRDMRAFFRAKDQLAQDEIAARQCWALQLYQRPRDEKLRPTDVEKLFVQMRERLAPQMHLLNELLPPDPYIRSPPPPASQDGVSRNKSTCWLRSPASRLVCGESAATLPRRLPRAAQRTEPTV